jgi:hypothetical protein
MLVVIGRDWVVDAHGRRRLDDPGDYVRLEIESALRGGIRIIPVLVAGAQMPAPADLPESLRPLTLRHAFELSDGRPRVDRAELLHLLDQVLGPPPAPPVPPGQSVAERIYDRLSAISKAIFVLEFRIASWPFRIVYRLVRRALGDGPGRETPPAPSTR